MAVTHEQLMREGAGEGLARLLAAELRRLDWTWNPMAVALVVVFLGFQSWLVLSDRALQADIAELRTDVALLQEGQKRLAADVAEIKADIAGIREGQAEIRALLAALQP